MSRRHRSEELRDKAVIHRAARAAKQRDRQSLRELSGAVGESEVDDLFAPPPAHRPPRHRNIRGFTQDQRSRFAHWKTKSWKRRKLNRSHRNLEESARLENL